MPEKKEPGSLVVLTFDSPLRAREVHLAVQRLMQQEALFVHDAVFIDRDLSGDVTVTETVDVKTGDAAVQTGLTGALIGTLVAGPIGTVVGGAVSAGLGALMAKLVDIGVPDAKVKEVEERLRPGASALILLISHIKEDALVEELRRFAGAELTESTLSPDMVMKLRSALRAEGS